jgi:uncharacterized membrane protein YjjP (DUF1212 family)
MHEVELTWNRSMRVWWLFVWRSAVGGFVFAFVVGFIAGFLNFVLGKPLQTGVFGAILGFVTSMIWSTFVIRMALQKHYRDFRIRLVPNPDPGGVFD